jgi:hypothetical protein
MKRNYKHGQYHLAYSEEQGCFHICHKTDKLDTDNTSFKFVEKFIPHEHCNDFTLAMFKKYEDINEIFGERKNIPSFKTIEKEYITWRDKTYDMVKWRNNNSKF